MKRVLFVCSHNAGRSQMAQAFFERHAPDDIRAQSAGGDPAPHVWPVVIEAMREAGVDLAGRKPTRLLTETQLHADWAITLGWAARARSCRRTSRIGTSPIQPSAASPRCGSSATRSRHG